MNDRDTFAEPQLAPVTLAALLARDFPPRELLLAPWLPRQGLAMIYASRGVGKTHLALSCAYAVATGTGLLGWQAQSAGRVLLMDGEMPGAVLKERLARLVATTGVKPPSDEHFRILAADMIDGGLPDLCDEEGQAMLAPAVEGADLIVVDNLSTLARTGKENEADSWAPLQGWILAQRRAGRSVLLIHHAGKGGDQRGTSRREDVLDTVIRLDRPGDYNAAEGARFTVNFTKARGLFGNAAESFEAALHPTEGWVRREIADVLASRAVALKADGLSQRVIAAQLGVSPATVNRALKRSGGED